MNRKLFYDLIRTPIFGGKISPAQLAGMEALLDEYVRRGWKDLRWLAYILGTVYHETARTMQPIEEFGKGKGLPYGQKLKMGDGPGKRVPYTVPNKLYYGRGHTQNTWFENYEKLTRAAKKQGFAWDFLNKPETLLEMAPSVWATFYAMEVGLYTGRKLADYFFGTYTDWTNARKIINGLDKAREIGDLSKAFYNALHSAAPSSAR